MNLKTGYKQIGDNKDSNPSVGSFAGTLLASAVITHIMHLQSKSYAEHMALGGFYDAIPGLVDSIVEAYQGCSGELICCYPNDIEAEGKDAIAYLKELKQYVIKQSTSMFSGNEYPNILNEVDAVTTLIDSTLYKLTFLK